MRWQNYLRLELESTQEIRFSPVSSLFASLWEVSSDFSPYFKTPIAPLYFKSNLQLVAIFGATLVLLV